MGHFGLQRRQRLDRCCPLAATVSHSIRCPAISSDLSSQVRYSGNKARSAAANAKCWGMKDGCPPLNREPGP